MTSTLSSLVPIHLKREGKILTTTPERLSLDACLEITVKGFRLLCLIQSLREYSTLV